MTEVTTQFAMDYLLDDCQDCPENKDGECMTQSHCFEVKQMAIKALKQYGVLQEIRDEMNILDDKGEFNISGALKILDKHISTYEDTL